MALIWTLDADNSEIQFTVGHLAATSVNGYFEEFESSISTEGNNLSEANVSVSIKTESISTNNSHRDKHLRSADFFNCAKYPEMHFTGKFSKKTGSKTGVVNGDLTIKNVSRIVTLTAESDTYSSGDGNAPRIVFVLSGTINRKDFGLRWNSISELGGLVISDKITLTIHAEYTAVNDSGMDT